MIDILSEEEIKKLSFEESFQKLEEIVSVLEGSDADLEKSIEYYDLGIKLKDHCSEKLKRAELKIKKITKNDVIELLDD